MDQELTTPRLKLTLLAHAARGSEEFAWLHELRSDKQAQHWSLHGPSATPEDTEKAASHFLPSAEHPLRIAYAIHDPSIPSEKSQFIGLITIHPLVQGQFLPLPAHLTPPPDNEEGTLVTELAYALLPGAWGKGYATEALTAVLGAVKASAQKGVWGEYGKVWMRVIVNGRNPGSLKVMRKIEGLGVGVKERGIFTWKGEPLFIGGEWRGEDDLNIFGGYVKGSEGGA